MKKIFSTLLILFVFLFTVNKAFAIDRTGAWIFLPSIAYYYYADKRHLDNQVMPNLAIEYGFHPHSSVQVLWGHLSSQYDYRNKQHVNGWITMADALYYLCAHDLFEPYILGGLGVMNLRPRVNDDTSVEMNFNLGAGLSWFLSQYVGLHFDMRGIYTPNGGKTDWMTNFGLNFMFGAKANNTDSTITTESST